MENLVMLGKSEQPTYMLSQLKPGQIVATRNGSTIFMVVGENSSANPVSWRLLNLHTGLLLAPYFLRYGLEQFTIIDVPVTIRTRGTVEQAQ